MKKLELVKQDPFKMVEAITGLSKEDQLRILRGEVTYERPPFLNMLPVDDAQRGKK